MSDIAWASVYGHQRHPVLLWAGQVCFERGYVHGYEDATMDVDVTLEDDE